MLVVDDNATNRHILEEWLRGWQMEPAAVGDGLAALDALWHGVACGRPYALVLLDARMPDTDGLALAAQIRERAELSATRIILLTSGDRPGDLARSRELRIDAHLLKPVQQDELLETIYRVMSRADGDAPTAAGRAAGNRAGAGPGRGTAAHPGGRGQRVQRATPGAAARPARPPRAAGEQRPGGAGPGGRGGLRPAAPGRPHAGAGRLPGRPGDPGAGADRGGPFARHRPDGALAEGRPRAVPGGRHGRLPGQADPGRRPVGGDRPGRGVPARRPSRPGPGLLDPRVLLGRLRGRRRPSWRRFVRRSGPACRIIWRPFRTPCGSGTRRGCARPLTSCAGWWRRFPRVAGDVASDLEDHAAQGQLEEARPLVEQLETMAQELMRLAGGLSLETLRHQAEAAGDPNRTASP